MRKLLICMMIGMTLLGVVPVHGAPLEQASAVDVGYYDVWLHSDGKTWQQGIAPGSAVTHSPTIQLPVDDSRNPKNFAVSYLGQLEAQYTEILWENAVTGGTITDFYYQGGGKLQYTINTTLTDFSGLGGLDIKERGQAALVEGKRFYIPVKITWEYAPRVLLPPDAWIECDVPTPYAGSTMPIESGVTNKNDYEVGVTYTLSLNGTTLKTATTTIKAKATLPVNASYKVPAKTTPGTLLNIKLTATIWDPENPAVRLSDTANCKRSVGIVDDSEADGRLKPSTIVE